MTTLRYPVPGAKAVNPAIPVQASRPGDVFPDDVDRAEFAGVTIRKGTIAAFLQNALRRSDPATTSASCWKRRSTQPSRR